MPPLVQLRERSASRSPSTFGAGIDGGRASVPLRLDDETQLEDAVLAVVGTVKPAGDGRLQRVCPLRHGRFKGYYAERVSGAEGVGTGQTHVTRLAPNENGNSLDDFSLYDTYTLTAEFLPRPYQVLSDDKITVQNLAWTDTDLVVNNTHSKVTTEYKRWCDYEVIDDSEFLEADQGCMYVATSNAAISPPSTDLLGMPHGAAFVGKPRLPIPQSKLFVYWYNVPYYYVTHSNAYLRRYRWRVNQRNLFGYGPGTLLYRNFTVTKRYTPFNPDQEDNAGAGPDLNGLVKWADLRLEFGLRDFMFTFAPTDDTQRFFSSPWNCAPTFVGNGSWGGVIKVDQTAVNNTAKWWPTYNSAPLEVLFTDPAA
jgi:hypothetical protein